jgi:cobalt-zinc-cadmium efflux system membrane fusion protein
MTVFDIPHKTPSSRTPVSTGFASLLIASAMLTLMAGCSSSDTPPKATEAASAKAAAHDDKDGLKLSEEEAKRAGITLETIALQSAPDAVAVTATITANLDRMARIAPRVDGRVLAAPASLGDRVRAGQVLATLDSPALGEAHSTLLRTLAAHRVAQADLQRAQALSADEIIPQRELLRAQGEADKVAAELRAAQDRMRMLGASPSAQASDPAQSSFALTSPFAGTVIQKKASVGELATPADPLFTVADLSTVWVEASLPEAALARVRTGARASVSVGAYPEERFDGRVTYVGNVLDKDTRSVTARIEVRNPDGRLKPEMFATARIETGASAKPALSVVDGAIVLLQGQPTVFVVEHGGYEARPVELGDKVEGRTLIKSGLADGDQIVSAGAYALKARLLKSQISDEH